MKRFLRILALNLLVLISTFTWASNEEVLNKETQLNIYPNPVMSGNEIKVEVEVSEHKLVHIYVFDFAGKLVMESTNLRVGFGQDKLQEEIVIDEKGLYLIKIISENEETHIKQTKVKKLYVI
jgi:hypothetical protein